MNQPYYPPPHPRKAVTKKRGVSMRGHSWNFVLTVCTCGAWAPVWFCWWIVRQFIRRREVTRYR